MTFKYYIWHDGQVKTSNLWGEALACGGAYVMNNTILSDRIFCYILPQGNVWMVVSPEDVPKDFQLWLLLLAI